ncbi:haloacid dehalogenase superfamily, subfamily IA, variant 3 with third motif having DD or ED [Thermoplasmatales archaeon BRNA1]|nr:haloacid dehalogenase superfamily, subfamily IA, variant 3 with third motif having DD or ED [Thermoplasmatales archaeon BRNA1]
MKAVIFDMDGTLIDTEKFNIMFWCEAGKKFGFGITPDDVIHIRSLDSRLVAKYFRERFGDSFDFETVRGERRRLMRAHVEANGIEPKPGIREVLDYLKGTGAKLAVATASTQEHADDYLEQIGVKDMFDMVISTHSVENGKPAPDVYLYACRCLGFDPKDCVAVEDAPFGIESAYRAGCHVVTVPDVSEPDEKQLDMLECVAETLDGLIPYFREIGLE